MTFSRPGCLRPLAACLLCSLPLLAQQAAPPPAPPAPAPAPAQGHPPAPPQRPNNPFEAVPQSQEAPPQQPPRLETPPPAAGQARPGEAPAEDVIEAIEFRGARRVPQDTLRALIFTKRGDKYDEDTLHRD